MRPFPIRKLKSTLRHLVLLLVHTRILGRRVAVLRPATFRVDSGHVSVTALTYCTLCAPLIVQCTVPYPYTAPSDEQYDLE